MTSQPTSLRLAVAAMMAAALLAGCSKDKPEPAKTPAAAAPVQDPMEVVLTPEMAKQFRIEKASMADIAITQVVAGRIEANERLTTRIGASVTGRVVNVLAEVGDRVKAGQVLAMLASPELTNAQLAYLRALSATKLA